MHKFLLSSITLCFLINNCSEVWGKRDHLQKYWERNVEFGKGQYGEVFKEDGKLKYKLDGSDQAHEWKTRGNENVNLIDSYKSMIEIVKTAEKLFKKNIKTADLFFNLKSDKYKIISEAANRSKNKNAILNGIMFLARSLHFYENKKQDSGFQVSNYREFIKAAGVTKDDEIENIKSDSEFYWKAPWCGEMYVEEQYGKYIEEKNEELKEENERLKKEKEEEKKKAEEIAKDSKKARENYDSVAQRNDILSKENKELQNKSRQLEDEVKKNSNKNRIEGSFNQAILDVMKNDVYNKIKASEYTTTGVDIDSEKKDNGRYEQSIPYLKSVEEVFAAYEQALKSSEVDASSKVVNLSTKLNNAVTKIIESLKRGDKEFYKDQVFILKIYEIYKAIISKQKLFWENENIKRFGGLRLSDVEKNYNNLLQVFVLEIARAIYLDGNKNCYTVNYCGIYRDIENIYLNIESTLSKSKIIKASVDKVVKQLKDSDFASKIAECDASNKGIKTFWESKNNELKNSKRELNIETVKETLKEEYEKQIKNDKIDKSYCQEEYARLLGKLVEETVLRAQTDIIFSKFFEGIVKECEYFINMSGLPLKDKKDRKKLYSLYSEIVKNSILEYVKKYCLESIEKGDPDLIVKLLKYLDSYCLNFDKYIGEKKLLELKEEVLYFDSLYSIIYNGAINAFKEIIRSNVTDVESMVIFCKLYDGFAEMVNAFEDKIKDKKYEEISKKIRTSKAKLGEDALDKMVEIGNSGKEFFNQEILDTLQEFINEHEILNSVSADRKIKLANMIDNVKKMIEEKKASNDYASPNEIIKTYEDWNEFKKMDMKSGGIKIKGIADYLFPNDSLKKVNKIVDGFDIFSTFGQFVVNLRRLEKTFKDSTEKLVKEGKDFTSDEGYLVNNYDYEIMSDYLGVNKFIKESLAGIGMQGVFKTVGNESIKDNILNILNEAIESLDEVINENPAFLKKSRATYMNCLKGVLFSLRETRKKIESFGGRKKTFSFDEDESSTEEDPWGDD